MVAAVEGGEIRHAWYAASHHSAQAAIASELQFAASRQEPLCIMPRMVDSVAAIMFGIATGFLPSATFMFALREQRSAGWTRNAATAIMLTAGFIGGESWAAAQHAVFLFEVGKGTLVILGVSGTFMVSSVAGFLVYVLFSTRN